MAPQQAILNFVLTVRCCCKVHYHPSAFAELKGFAGLMAKALEFWFLRIERGELGAVRSNPAHSPLT